MPTSTAALNAALALGAEHGIRSAGPRVLRERHNVLVHLAPAPVVVRVTVSPVRTRAHLDREVAVQTHLAHAGAPVVPPSPHLPPGPHERDGFAMTAWAHVPSTGPVDPAAAGAALADLHAALRTFTGTLPRLGVLDEAANLAARHAPDLTEAVAVARADVEALGLPDQPLHGDAHLGNVIAAADGPRWIDLEDTFLGPLGWDLACLGAFADDPAPPAAALAAHGGDAPPPALLAARRVQGAVWVRAMQEARPAR